MQNRDFKGIWIPKEIWLNSELSIVEKALLAEIDSLKDCEASNEYFAKFFGVSERTITRAISHLREIGLIDYSFDGRKRYLRLVKMTRQTSQNDEQLNNDISNNNTRNNIKTNNQSSLFEDNNTSNNYNKEKAQNFVDQFNRICVSLPKCMRLTAKRSKGISNILKKYSEEEITEVFRKLEASDFCTGRSGKWRADIDFILREDKFISVLEGKYDNHKQRRNVETSSGGEKKQYTAEERERIIKNGKKF